MWYVNLTVSDEWWVRLNICNLYLTFPETSVSSISISFREKGSLMVRFLLTGEEIKTLFTHKHLTRISVCLAIIHRFSTRQVNLFLFLINETAEVSLWLSCWWNIRWIVLFICARKEHALWVSVEMWLKNMFYVRMQP